MHCINHPISLKSRSSENRRPNSVEQTLPPVIHYRDFDRHPGAIYIGRASRRKRLQASKFANPFVIGRDGNREEVIAKFARWLDGDAALIASHGPPPTRDEIRRELAGKPLACWCAPHACHGDILAVIAAGNG